MPSKCRLKILTGEAVIVDANEDAIYIGGSNAGMVECRAS